MAETLGSKLELPLIHLDMLYWRDNWENASEDEFDNLLLKQLSKPKLIIDGNMNRTIPLRVKYCDYCALYGFLMHYMCFCGYKESCKKLWQKPL